MRALRLAPFVLCAALLAGVLVGGTSASVGSPAATPHNLQAPTSQECAAASAVVLGKACVDKRGMILANEWTVQDGRAQMIHPNQWDISFSWSVPQSISAKGAQMKLSLSATELTRGANARICPAMGVRGGFALKESGAVQGQPVQIGTCAQAGGSADATKTVTLVPGTATPGTFAFLTVGIQDGPFYTYKYKAVAAQPKCRRLSSVGAPAACIKQLTFVFTQGGRRPKGMPAWVTDVVTAGAGSGTFDDTGRGFADLEKVKARVVRSMEVARSDPDTGVTVGDVKLVFRADPSRNSSLALRRKEPSALSIPLSVVSSDDPLCEAPRAARLSLADGKGTGVDIMNLTVVGCPHQSATFRGSVGPNSAVKVVLTAKPA